MALIIFDLDDTLYQSEEYSQARQKALMSLIARRHKTTLNEAEKLFRDAKEELRKAGGPPSATVAFMNLGISRNDFLKALDEPEIEEFIKPSERTKDAIKKLAKQHDLVLYSNSPSNSVMRLLRVLQIEKFFSGIYDADRFPQSKPYIPALEFILATHKKRPVISVGDSIEKDLLPLRDFGATLIWVSPTDIAHPQVDAVIRDVGDLLQTSILKEITKGI